MSEKRVHKTAEIHFRVSTKDRAVMEAAAKEAGLTLSNWMRRSLLLAAAGKPVQIGDAGVGISKTIDASFRPPSLRPDPDKIADFQRKAGMGGVKSR